MSEPLTFARLLEQQQQRRRDLEDRLGGGPSASLEDTSDDAGSPAADPEASDAGRGGVSSGDAPTGKLSDEERAVVEDRAAKGDPVAIALVESLEAEAGPRVQAGDVAARKGPRVPKSAAEAFNQAVRGAVAFRKSTSGRSGGSSWRY